MLTGSLPQRSNLATWRDLVKCTDETTGAVIDLEPLVEEITVDIRFPGDTAALLEATYTDGAVTFNGTGIFEFLFTEEQMATLCSGDYEFGSRVKYLDAAGGDTEQIVLCTVPILRGL